MFTNLRLTRICISTIRPRRFILLLFPLFCVDALLCRDCCAQRGLGVAEFAALSHEEQRRVLGAALQQWLQDTENIHVKSESRLAIIGFHDGVAVSDELVRDVGRYECDFRRLAPDYFAATRWYLQEGSSERMLFDNKTTLDARTGVVRMYSFDTQLSTHWGAIDTAMDKLTEAHRFAHWFGGDFDVEFSFPIRFLLEHLNAILFEGIEQDGLTVRLSLIVDYPPNHRNVRSVWIDPTRGYLPVRIHFRSEDVNAYDGKLGVIGDGWFAENRTDVLEMRLIDRLWIPWRFEQVFWNRGSVIKSEANRWMTVVSDARSGVVTRDMLTVEFPAGTQIHDRIRGEFIGFDSPNSVRKSREDLTTTPPRGDWSWMIALHGMLFFCIAFWYLRRRSGLCQGREPPQEFR